jgi:hypothetical protein
MSWLKTLVAELRLDKARPQGINARGDGARRSLRRPPTSWGTIGVVVKPEFSSGLFLNLTSAATAVIPLLMPVDAVLGLYGHAFRGAVC